MPSPCSHMPRVILSNRLSANPRIAPHNRPHTPTLCFLWPTQITGPLYSCLSSLVPLQTALSASLFFLHQVATPGSEVPPLPSRCPDSKSRLGLSGLGAQTHSPDFACPVSVPGLTVQTQLIRSRGPGLAVQTRLVRTWRPDSDDPDSPSLARQVQTRSPDFRQVWTPSLARAPSLDSESGFQLTR